MIQHISGHSNKYMVLHFLLILEHHEAFLLVIATNVIAVFCFQSFVLRRGFARIKEECHKLIF